MDYAKGRVVRSLKGHDKGGLFIITNSDSAFVWLVDGKTRKKHNPKRKNLRHIVITDYLMPEFESLSDKNIRKELNRLNK